MSGTAAIVMAGFGLGFAIAGVVALVYARRERAKADRSAGTETSTCGEIAGLAEGVAGEVGGRLFSQRCELVGRARPEQDELTAPFSSQPCVWHRSQIVHHYWEMRTTPTPRATAAAARRRRA